MTLCILMSSHGFALLPLRLMSLAFWLIALGLSLFLIMNTDNEEINKNPKPIIWKEVFNFPEKSELISTIALLTQTLVAV